MTGEWRKLHNNLYSSSSKTRMIKVRRIRWVRHVARMGEKTNEYMLILVRMPELKRPLKIPEHRWVDNIKMDLGERVVWLRIGTSGGLLRMR
jgi:hypothetical protein